MTNRFTDSNQISHEVQRQFLRRTPIKLKQFARLLTDMMEQKVEPLRVKALLSQATKTREACILQGYDSTARLLDKLTKQLSMAEDSVESQKPLLKRLSKRLIEHSEKLELGVKPQKPETSQSIAAKTTDASSGQENETEEDESIPFGLYADKGKLIFVSNANFLNEIATQTDDGEPGVYNELNICGQFESMGLECCVKDTLETALDEAKLDDGGIVIASLELAESLDVLDDAAVEQVRPPLIFIGDEDNQENRAKAIRNGATGFIVRPLSISTIYEQIERLYHPQADSPRRVLVMEDSKAQARYYQKVLSKGHFEVLVINDPNVLLEALRGFDPECILMDMQMPGSSGIELTQIIRQLPRYTHLPILFLSAEESLKKQNQALMSGGTAFIVKPVQKEQLMFMAGLYTQRFRNLSPQIEINPDTNLPYSAKFKQIIAIETARISRTPSSIALAVIQLDDWEDLAASAHFSFINSAVQQLALLLHQRLRKTDIVGHLESGKVGVILTSGRKEDWLSIIQNVQQQFSELAFQLLNQNNPMTISAGLSALESNYNAHQWLERALNAQNAATLEGPSSIKWEDLDES